MLKKTLFLFLILPFISFGQDCSCQENFKWVKKTFEENDAGFQYAIDQKGKEAYAVHTEKYLEKTKSITDLNECANAMNDWLRFFRNGHFGVNVKNNTPSTSAPTNANVAKENNSWEKFDISDSKFQSYVSKIKQPDFDGIWTSPPYTIGVVKKDKDYIGFIIDAPGTGWKKGQVKFKIKKDPAGTGYTSDFYMRDFSEQKLKTVEKTGNNFLRLGNISLTRLSPKFEDSPEIKLYQELSSAALPFIREISKNTLIVRIPSFNGDAKKYIDSIFKANHAKITSTENLIIDMRNNGGGNDSSYSEILPYAYTNPFRSIGVEFLSTPLNNKRMEDFLNTPGVSEKNKERIREYLKKLNGDNLGKFVKLNENDVDVQTLDTIYEYPKNIAVIINHNNGSTAEQFLLDMKQSKKVKLFGTTTMGVLDISNMYFVDSPCNNFNLGYSLSKSLRIPNMTIDGKGIQPDYYIDSAIPDLKWVDYVQSILNSK